MARYPFLIEIRPGKLVKDHVKAIVNDVNSTFNIRGLGPGHDVPHVTLFGPFDADGYRPVLSAIRSACEQYSVVPYRLDGFCHFRDDVVYIDLATSPEFRDLRRSLRDELLPVTRPLYPRREAGANYQYHMTVAHKQLDGKFNRVWKYVNDNYDPRIETYAHRVTFLNKGRIVKEWDLLAADFLDRRDATNRWSWDRTMRLLKERRSNEDHASLSKPHRGGVREYKRLVYRVASKL